MLVVSSSMFGLVHSARSVFEIDLERADMQQRARVSMDCAVQRSRSWRAQGCRCRPSRRFAGATTIPTCPARRSRDRISVRYMPPDAAAGGAVTITYALRDDACRRAAVDEVRRALDRSACRRPGRRSALRVFRRRRAADCHGAFHRRSVGSRCGGGGSLRCRSPGDTPSACARARPSGAHVRGRCRSPISRLRIDVSPRNVNLQ